MRLKLPPLMDADDWQTAGTLVIFSVMAALWLVAFAATAALAWLVFRAVGGL